MKAKPLFFVAVALWLLAVHAIFFLLVWKEADYQFFARETGLHLQAPAENSRYIKNRRSFLHREFRHQQKGAALFIGDSRTEGLNVRAVAKDAVNLGIGGDTSLGVRERVLDYVPFEDARYIVLAIGINDLKYRKVDAVIEHYAAILEAIKKKCPVFVVSVLPVDPSASSLSKRFENTQVAALNSALRALSKSKGATYIDVVRPLAGPGDGASEGSDVLELGAKYHIGDGVHLNAAGQAILIAELRRLLPAS